MKASAAVYWAALGTALLLPFAAIPPLVVTPWFSLTDDKLGLLVLICAWLCLGRAALPTRGEWRALLPTGALIGVSMLSAWQAPSDYSAEAARYLARLAAAGFVLLVAFRFGHARFAVRPGHLHNAAGAGNREHAGAGNAERAGAGNGEHAGAGNAERAGAGNAEHLGCGCALAGARRRRALLWAVAIGGGLSGLLGLGEALHISALDPILGLFKVAPTRVGGELRVSASFQYATIASMYFEMVAPLAIVLAATTSRAWLRTLGVAIAVVCTATVVLSLTRAGMLTLLLVYAVLVAVALSRKRWRSMLGPSLTGAATLAAGVGLLFLHDQVFDLRLVTESDADWYGAVYEVPASLDVRPNQPLMVDLDVRNEGRITWTATGTTVADGPTAAIGEGHPFALGYRWLTDDGTGVLDIPPAEVQLSHDVQPGETIHLEAAVRVPDLPAGSYRLDWGMLQRDVLQFYERGWADAETEVIVNGPNSGSVPSVTPRDDGEAPWVVGRLDLWGAAARLIAAHPLLGVGPDNFRHFYGTELGLEGWDERIEANNLYLEVFADLGVLGLAAFVWVVIQPLQALWRGLHGAVAGPADGSRTNTADPASSLGVFLAIGAFLVHGLLDSFLAFTPTVLLFWLLLGVAQNQKPQVSGR